MLRLHPLTLHDECHALGPAVQRMQEVCIMIGCFSYVSTLAIFREHHPEDNGFS